jgi:hypothetical protein
MKWVTLRYSSFNMYVYCAEVSSQKSLLQDRTECISMSTARDAAIQQTFHSSPTLFTGLEIRTSKITFMILYTDIKLLTAML